MMQKRSTVFGLVGVFLVMSSSVLALDLPLHEAVVAGDLDRVRVLIADGVDVNTVDGDGTTALHWLRHEANPNLAEEWRGQTALMWAAAENNLDVAHALTSAGADIHARSTGGFSPLMFAVRAGHLDMARLLVDAGASPEETLYDGTSALVLAAKNGHYELGNLLLEHGADPNADDQGWTALHEVKWTRRPNLGFNNPPPIVTGSMQDVDFVRSLALHGADLNRRMTKEPNNRYPLMVAAGVGIWAVGESPGTNKEALAAVKYALELGGDATTVDDNGDTALHGATIRSSEPLVRFLLAEGADIDAINEKGWTPLRIARGVFYSNTGKRWPEMEVLLHSLGADERLVTGADNTISDWTVEAVEPR